MFTTLLVMGLYSTIVSYLYVKARIKQSEYLNGLRAAQNTIQILQKQRDNNVIDVADADSVWDNFEK